MLCLHPVADVPGPKLAHGRQDSLWLIQTSDDKGQRRYQVTFLFAQILFKQRPEAWVYFKEPAIKEVGDGIGRRLDLPETLLD
jgi:hypothetical protein